MSGSDPVADGRLVVMAIALHWQIMQAISPICTREVSGDVIGGLNGLGLIGRKPLRPESRTG